jgi:hypothetical protein
MSAEATIFSTLTGFVAGRVYPDVAPSGAALPRVVFQQVGGQADVFLDGSLPDKENGRIQVACWATTRAAAITLAKQVEVAMTGSASFICRPMGARISGYEPETNLYSSHQDFSIWSTR